jgi:hypothetical protein
MMSEDNLLGLLRPDDKTCVCLHLGFAIIQDGWRLVRA